MGGKRSYRKGDLKKENLKEFYGLLFEIFGNILKGKKEESMVLSYFLVFVLRVVWGSWSRYCGIFFWVIVVFLSWLAWRLKFGNMVWIFFLLIIIGFRFFILWVSSLVRMSKFIFLGKKNIILWVLDIELCFVYALF